MNTQGNEIEHMHDQLPTVEEVHEIRRRGQIRRRKKFLLVTFAIIAALSVSIGAVLAITRREKEKEESERTRLVLEFLKDGTVSSSSDLWREGSPQRLASEWISTGDDMHLAVPSGRDDKTADRFILRYVAAVLYFSLGGSNWNDSFHFLSQKNVCDWNTYYTDSASEFVLLNLGIECNAEEEPRTIMMPSNNMFGSIPTEIGLLTSLTALAFQTNKITGTLPPQMANLRDLKGALFYTNELSGTIPAWLGVLSNLEWLSMPSNKFSGSIPDELGSLSLLELLNFQNNFDIVGSIPDTLQNLKHLERIYLSYNKLVGTIPYWIGNFANLTDLRLSNNGFSSSIPESLSNAAKLTSLFLDDNNLTGNLSVIESLTNLEWLIVEDNNFRQTLDSNFLASLDKLRLIDASSNKLKGPLPLHLFQMDQLQVLDLHGNEIHGNLPEFTENKKLEFLSLHENNIHGNIPDSIANLKNLTHLDLSTNKFDGIIPANIGNMATLAYLFLATNDFDEGTIPDNLQNLSNLRELSLKGTSRNGDIPDWIGDLQDLILLDLDDNYLIGTIPMAIGDLKDLKFLILNRNRLTGILPAVINEIRLKILLVDNNLISGLGSSTNSLPFCNSSVVNPIIFTADCGGVSPELDCPCCTECCESNSTCNDGSDFLANNDPIWEHGYNRMRYEFSDDTIFVVRRNGI